MQTALHIYSLVREMKEHLLGAKFKTAEFYKKQREAYLLFKGKKGTLALGLVYHPHGYGSFLLPRGKINIETNEKPWPFFQEAFGCEISSIKQYDLDRIFKIELSQNEARYTIIVEAIGPNGNFWLLNDNSKIIATLRNKKYDAKEPYQPPPEIGKLNPFNVEKRHLIEIFSRSDQNPENVIRKNIIGLDKNMINEIINRAGIETSRAAELSMNEIENILSNIKEMSIQFEDYHRGYSYSLRDGNFAYPFKLKAIDESYNKLKSLSHAVYDAVRCKRAARSEVNRHQVILDALARHIKRTKRKLTRIDKDLQTAKDFEQYKKYAELIKIFGGSIKKGMEFAELTDVWSSEGDKIIVELDPALPPMQNAELYFKKYRKGRQARELLQRRLEIAEKELISTENMHDEFKLNFETAMAKYESEINDLLPATGEAKATMVRLPYRKTTLSTGVTIFVGRDGADNDSTTFAYAKPHELWFHASQCPGSHVVLKFPDKNFVPSKGEIAETAAIAAFFSKARNSTTVPVIYTQKKYVRKPRKAKPGLVTVEREKTIMVRPMKPEFKEAT